MQLSSVELKRISKSIKYCCFLLCYHQATCTEKLNEMERMHVLSYGDFAQIYHILCVLTTVGILVWCLYMYDLDEDTSQVDFKRYHETEDDLYPSLTLCLKDPFDDSKLKQIPKLKSRLKTIKTKTDRGRN